MPDHKLTLEDTDIERLKAVAEAIGHGVLLVSMDNEILFANSSLVRMLDYEDASQICGRHIGEFFDPQTYEYVHGKVSSEMSKDGKWMAEFPILDRRDAPIHAIHDIFMLPDANGKFHGYGSIITDVTQQKESQYHLRNYAKRIEEENKRYEDCRKEVFAERSAKSAFLMNLSHELRTSLHAISSFSQFGRKNIEDASRDELTQYFDQIQASGDTLLKSLDTLLELDRHESQMGTIDRVKTDLYDLVRMIVEEFQYGGALQSRTIVFDQPEFDVNAQVDRSGIMRVVRSLVENAVRYSPDESEITIEILQPRPRWLAIRVADRGDGIANSELDVIFNKFYRSVSKTNDDDFRHGAGLGLAICKEIVAMHGGAIEAQNRQDGGAVFQFEIPIEPTE